MIDPVFERTENKESLINVTDEAHIEKIIPGGKYSRAFGIITIVLFIGILLSFLVNFGVSAYLGTEELVNSYFDGEEHPDIILSDFSNTFYLSKEIQNNIIKVDYDLFGRLPTSDVILGSDEFLFPTYDEANDYSYVADYLGAYKPNGTELDIYLNAINDLTKEYKKYGATPYFIVIPNTQTIYSDKMPEYMGGISNNTRLKSITRYFQKRGVINFIDLTDALISAKDKGELYNNTENSLNSRGAYFAYLSITKNLPKDVRDEITEVELTDKDFVKHNTDGKHLARIVSLQNKIKNRTVSLSADFVQKYQTFLKSDDYEMTTVKIQYKNEVAAYPKVLLQFSDDWDRIIMTDYFSNTFATTMYSIAPRVTKEMLNKDPHYVFFFIHENELHKFIDGSLMPRN